MILAGSGGEVGGVLLEVTGVGAPAGVALNSGSAVVIAEGAADIGAGRGVFMSAMNDNCGNGKPTVS